MIDNKNQLREDVIEFAIQISDLCDEIKGCSVYVNQIVRSSSSIGANIHEAKYAQSKENTTMSKRSRARTAAGRAQKQTAAVFPCI